MRHLIFVLASLISLNLYAQLPDGSIAPDFTATDIEGNEWNLYQLLGEGKTVILEFTATWCGPCWNYSESGVLNNMYTSFGPDGTDDLMVLKLESDNTTTLNDLEGTGPATIGDWISSTSYPIIDNAANIFDNYSNAYYPTIYTVCPDMTLVQSGQATFEGHIDAAFAPCNNFVNGVPALVMTYTGETSSCGGAEWLASTEILNVGGVAVNDMLFEITINGTPQSPIYWTGNIDSGATVNVDLGSYTDVGSLEISISSINGESWDLVDSINILGSEESTTSIQVKIMTDNWPEETGWSITNAFGTAVAGSDVGAYSSANYEYVTEVSLDLNECYTFTLIDTYGDGLNASYWGDYPDGYAQVVKINGDTELGFVLDYQGSSGVWYEFIEIGMEVTEETYPSGVYVGCTEASACNYNPDATIDDGSCIYPEEFYDCDGLCIQDDDNDGICNELEISGCTDPEANNYDPSATDDDGTCIYFTPSCNTIGDAEWGNFDTDIYPSNSSGVFGEYLDLDLVLNINETIYDPTGNQLSVTSILITDVQGLPNGFSIDFNSSYLYPLSQECISMSGTPFETGVFLITFTGLASVEVFDIIIEVDISFTHTLEIGNNPNPIIGCTYPNAANYNIYASDDDGSCEFYGCMDELAINYNLLATIDDDSCFYEYNSSACFGDLNFDDAVTTEDLLLLLTEFGQLCE